jgi:hypothetical protein
MPPAQATNLRHCPPIMLHTWHCNLPEPQSGIGYPARTDIKFS